MFDRKEEEEEKKFRKTSVKAVLIDDSVYLNLNVRVLKFTEVIEDKDMRKITSVRNDADFKEEKSTSEKGGHQSNFDPSTRPTNTAIARNEDGEERFDDNGASDKDSNPSVADGAGEELKQLKDFKALISEKTEPKSIKTLSRAIFGLGTLLIVLACKFHGAEAGLTNC